jgi:GntR family transcriptional regulator, vanillate catabolism transcriptional regulator
MWCTITSMRARKGRKPAPVVGDAATSGSQNARALVTLREMLLRGEFRPGERISELPLAARLSMSRTPVRLALERLALEGMLDPAAGGGFSVRTYTLLEIWDAIELRSMLEGTAARLAAERLTHARELEALRTCKDQIEALAQQARQTDEPDLEFLLRYSDLNNTFHATLVELARSTMLQWTLARLQSVPFAAPSATIIPEGLNTYLDVALSQHEEIVDAIARKDADRAEAVAREHARLGRKNLEIALKKAMPGASLVRIA